MKRITIAVSSLLLSCYAVCTDSGVVKTSVMDAPDYRLFCAQAAQEPETFALFRSDPLYQYGLEHVTDYQARECLRIIKEQSPHFFTYVDRFKTSELVGSPVVAPYDELDVLAPTTVRYIKIASDVERLFGSLDGLSILEIGGGYGGQCKILADLYTFKSYTIVDLPEPLALTQAFLAACNVENVTLLSAEQELPVQDYDLVISNYALSECSMQVQQRYIDQLLRHATRGYLTCNVLPQEQIKVPYQHELLQMLAQAYIPYTLLAEEPLTNWNNYVVVWNKQACCVR